MSKVWTKEEDEILKKHFWTNDSHEIAKLLPGRTYRAVQHRAKKLGLKKSPSDRGRIESLKWKRELIDRLGEPICNWLERRYNEEHATYRELTAEANINTRSLMRLMNKCGIEPLTPQKAVNRTIENNPDFLANLHKAAGSPKAQRSRAKYRQENSQELMNEGELDLLGALHEAELAPIPELAFDVFNIDFAFPDIKLAVELDSTWHNSESKAPTDERKEAALSSAGWSLLRLDLRTSTSYNVAKVVDAVNSLA